MSANLSAIFYLISGVLFILALRGLSSPETSRQGNFFGILGMVIAVTVTFLSIGNFSSGFIYVLIFLLIGGLVGAFIAYKIPMTAMPELVAGFHSLVGLAAVFVAISAFLNPEAFNLGSSGNIKLVSLIEMSIGAAVGAITFSGSVIAFLKTQKNLDTPDIQIQYIPFSVGSLKKRVFHDFPGMAAACYQLRPNSMGSIHISSNKSDIHPEIKFNFFSDERDKKVLIDAVKIMRKIVEAKPMDHIRDYEHAPGEKISTDDEIENFIRENAETGFHPSGTCRMGSGSNTVVNDQLKIHGITNLRVADASIFPTIPSGNINAACIMVGEKVSEFIKNNT